MFNERLGAAVAAAQRLSDAQQEKIAELIEIEVAWDEALDDPRHHTALDALEAQALQEILAGEISDRPGESQPQ